MNLKIDQQLVTAAKAARRLRQTQGSVESFEDRNRILMIALKLLPEDEVIAVTKLIFQVIGHQPSVQQPKLCYRFQWAVSYDPPDPQARQQALQIGVPNEFFDESVELQRIVIRLIDEEKQRLIKGGGDLIRLSIMRFQLICLPSIPLTKIPDDDEIVDQEEPELHLHWMITRNNLCPFGDFYNLSLSGDLEMFVLFMRSMVKLLGQPIAERWDSTKKIFTVSWPCDRLIAIEEGKR